MKKLIFFYLFTLAYTVSFAQEINEAYIKSHYTKIETYIPMRDGVKLFTSIYIPKNKQEKYPILLNRTPYTVAPYGTENMKSYLGNFPEMSKSGYIFVYQDVRGKWMSEGTYENIRPTMTEENRLKIDESTDTYDTIDWLIKYVENNNGRVGMYGISYPGFYSTAGLIGAHPALKAVSPQAPVTDWFIGDDFHHGGALFLMDAFRFMYTFDAPRPKPVNNSQSPQGFNLASKDFYKFFLENPTLSGLKNKYLDHTVKFWDDLATHSTRDTFWMSRTITEHLDDVNPAVLVVGGFFDAEDTYGTFATYKSIEQRNPNNKSVLVAGPWFHGGWVRSDGDYFGDIRFGEKTSLFYRKEIELPFFEYYLKDKGKYDPAEATIYLTGSNEWQKFDQWPPKEIREKTFYLTENGKISDQNIGNKGAKIEYLSDPNKPVPFQDGIITDRTREYMIEDQRFTANRPDVMVFESESLSDDLTVTGAVAANLQVAMTGTDADFVVKLIDVYPDTTTASSPRDKETIMSNYQMLVRGEILRGRFRNSYSVPEPFVPNQATNVKVDLPDIAHTFKKGHKIMVQIQHSWFPLADRNPNQFIDIYQAKKEDYITNKHTLFVGSDNPSSIVLPVLSK